MKRLLTLLLAAAPAQAQSLLAPPHPLFGETGHIRVSENSGDLAIEYPFHLPVARGRYAPVLELSYWSGSSASSVTGLGWALTTSFIEANLRAAPLGVDATGAVIERAQYWLQLNGDRKLLVSIGSNQYRPDVGRSYLLATATGAPPTVWTAVDGLGTTYTFSPQGSDNSRWYLTMVVDANGNKTAFEYVPDNDSYPAGHSLLSVVRYNSVGSCFGHQVVIGYDIVPGTVPAEGGQGLLGLPNKRLKTVTVQRQQCPSATSATLYSYQLDYVTSAATSRQLLTGIAQLAADGTPLGKDAVGTPLGARFTYTPFTSGFSLSAYHELLPHPAGTPADSLCRAANCGLVNPGCQPQDVAAWMDLDGDGLPDMVWGQTSAPNPSGDLSGGGLFWAKNLSRPGAPAFAATRFMSGSDLWRGGGVGGGAVSFNTAGRSRDPATLQAAQIFTYLSGTGVTMTVQDFDGDGRPDLLSVEAQTCTSTSCVPQCTDDQLAIRFNKPDASGAPTFDKVSCVQLPPALLDDFASMAYVGARMIEWSESVVGMNATEQYLGLFDMNGDGILDFVVSVGDAFRVYRGYRNSDGTFGFAPPRWWTTNAPWVTVSDGWFSTFTYGAGALIRYPAFNGTTYRSLAGSNQGNQPGTSPKWASVILRRPLRQTINWSDCGPAHPRATTALLVDLNGEGLLDYVVSPINTTDGICYNSWSYAPWSVSYNTGTGFADRADHALWQSNWDPTPAPPTSPGVVVPSLETPLISYGRITDRADTFQQVALQLDLTRDGRPDRVFNGDATCKFQLRVNTGAGFAPNKACIDAPPDLISAPASAFSDQALPDWQTADSVPATCKADGTYASTGAVDCNSTPKACGCSVPLGACSASGKNGLFIDLDGDGVPDYVVADPWTHAIGWYPGRSPTIRGELISSVLQLGGARTDITYTSSNQFGQTSDGGGVRYVVSQTLLQGPGLQPLTTDYEYAMSRIVAALDDPTRREPLGFADSWSRDRTTGLVHHTRWGRAHATRGTPLLVETFAPVAAGQPLSSTNAVNATPFHSIARSYGSHSAMSANSCLDDASGLDGTMLPAVVIESSTETQTDSGLSLASTRTVSCADVDTAGHVLKVAITEDTKDRSWAGAPAVRVENFVYPTAGATCKDCLQEVWASDPSGFQPFHRWLFYDPSGNLDHVEELANGVREISEYRAYNADGTPASVTKRYAPGPYTAGTFDVVHSYTYDPLGLSVTKDTTTDGTITLRTDTEIDPTTGLPSSISGPYVTGSPAPIATKAFTYDKFFRMAGIGRAPATVANTVAQAITAFEYVPASQVGTGAVKTYSFALPINLTIGQVPATDDVLLSIAYFDASGRTVQTRKRLGAAPTGDPSASVDQHLSGIAYQVDATVFDGAGREVHHLDPYYATGDGFYDYWAKASLEASSDGSSLRATSKAYDALGRPACSVYWPLASVLPTPPSDATHCLSSFAEGPGYSRATAMRYGADVSSLARPFFTVETVADWINTAPGAPSTGQYFDAQGRIIFQRDAYGNFTETKRDILGRTTAAIRWAGSPNSSPVKASFLAFYDQRGRVVEEDDDSWGTKYYAYLPTGERVLTTHVPRGAGPGSSLATFEKQIIGSLGRMVEHVYSKYVPSAPPGATSCASVTEQIDDDVLLSYDTPYASGSYGYTAGRLSSQQHGKPTAYWIAYGYTADGKTAQRDEFVQGLSGAHTVARSYRNDGQPLATTVTSATLPTLTYAQTYDSAGRPSRVSGGSTVYWDMPRTNTSTGAYDAAGNIPAELADNGSLTVTRSFSAFSGQMLSHSILSSTGNPFWEWSNATWAGEKLTGNVLKSRFEVAAGATYSAATGTSYLFEYDKDGRLGHARATPPVSAPGPATQSYDEQFSFLMDATSGKSLWNLQQVQSGVVDSSGKVTGVVTSNYAYQPGAYDRMVEIARSGTAAPESFGYDERGRGLIVTHKVNGSIAERFAYDAPGRLTGVAVNGVVQENVAFDAEGLLVSRTFGAGSGDVARYYVDADLTVVQRGAATLAYVHVIVGKRRVASVLYTSPTATGQIVYYHRDRLGSVVGTSTSGGIAGAAYRYDIYGQLTATAGIETDLTASELGYAGALKLSDGLLHLKTRTYSPALRKFLQPDTVDPLRYTYVRGDPANLIDPSGRDAASIAHNVAELTANLAHAADIVTLVGAATLQPEVAGPAFVTSFFLHTVSGLASGVEALTTTNSVDQQRAIEQQGQHAMVAAEMALTAGLFKVFAEAVEGLGARGRVGSASEPSKPFSNGEPSRPTGESVEGGCFVAGTPVLTTLGYQPIESIQPGDLIWSRDPITGASSWQPVLATGVRVAHEIGSLAFMPADPDAGRPRLISAAFEYVTASQSANVDEIRATAEHPFWVKSVGWVAANELTAGDSVLTAGSLELKIQASSWKSTTAYVFNLTVAHTHSYFVGHFAAWVHNQSRASGKGSNTQPTKTDALKEHVTRSDLDAARREAKGEVVARKPDGTPYDHVTEVREAQGGLLNRISKINRALGNPSLTAAERAVLERELKQASKLLDKSEEFLPR